MGWRSHWAHLRWFATQAIRDGLSEISIPSGGSVARAGFLGGSGGRIAVAVVRRGPGSCLPQVGHWLVQGFIKCSLSPGRIVPVLTSAVLRLDESSCLSPMSGMLVGRGVRPPPLTCQAAPIDGLIVGPGTTVGVGFGAV